MASRVGRFSSRAFDSTGRIAVALIASMFALPDTRSAEIPANFDDLIKSRKYESAFEALQKADPNNEDPDTFARKVDIAVNFYVLCIGNELFAFKNLDPGEEIEKLRGGTGKYVMHSLDVAKESRPLLERFAANGRLHKAVGDWYFHGIHGCGLDKALAGEAASNYRDAEKLGAADAAMLRNLGLTLLEQGNAQDAAVELQASLKLEDSSAEAHYNLAHASHTLERDGAAAEHARRAFDLYTDRKLKSEAALLAAVALFDVGDKAAALRYADQAEALKLGNYYYILTKLLELYVRAGESARARDEADELFALQPTNPRLTQDVMQAYAGPLWAPQREAFFVRNLPKYAQDRTAHGNLLYHYALCDVELDNQSGAIAKLEMAREDFRTHADANGQALEAVEARLRMLRQSNAGDAQSTQ